MGNVISFDGIVLEVEEDEEEILSCEEILYNVPMSRFLSLFRGPKKEEAHQVEEPLFEITEE